jgi:RHS repeat-associated protein
VGASYVRSLSIDEPFVRQTSAGNEFYHVDALGSTLDLTNQAGAVQTSYQYEAFGKTTITGTSSNPFQYTGRENDGTGLYYYRARYHNPSYERFISEDPILAPMNPFAIGLCRITNDTVWLLPSRLLQPEVENGSKLLNGYAYSSNNPLRFIDSTGLEPKKPDEDCKNASDDCVKALKDQDAARPDGTTVSACYSAGMSLATYGRGNYRANHASTMEKCTANTPYGTYQQGAHQGEPVWPTPSACQNKSFQDKCPQ